MEPVFKNVLRDEWSKLGNVIRKHYFLRPYSQDSICVSGEMEKIHHHSNLAKMLIPLGMVFGSIVPKRGRNIPIDVHYSARENDSCIHWDRVFRFDNSPPFHFKSFMQHVSGNEVIEFVRFGVGMRLAVTVENGALVFRSKGYVWKVFGMTIPIPAGLLFGQAYVEERPVDEQSFRMKMVLNHQVFGSLFRYSGTFRLPEEVAASGA